MKSCRKATMFLWHAELGGIALIVDHELKTMTKSEVTEDSMTLPKKKLPEGNFPAKPFFGVDPVILDPKLVKLLLLVSIIGHSCCQLYDYVHI